MKELWEYQSTFHKSLSKDNSLTIHQHNLQNPVLEVFLMLKWETHQKIKNKVFDIVDHVIVLQIKQNSGLKTFMVRYGTETAARIGILCQIVAKHQPLLKNLRLS